MDIGEIFRRVILFRVQFPGNDLHYCMAVAVGPCRGSCKIYYRFHFFLFSQIILYHKTRKPATPYARGSFKD